MEDLYVVFGQIGQFGHYTSLGISFDRERRGRRPALEIWADRWCSEGNGRLANLDPELAGQLVAFWTALHDLGKAAPSFQQRCLPAKQTLEAHGFTFPPTGNSIRHHSLLSAWILEKHLAEVNLAPRSTAKKLAMAIAGHHGIFPANGQFNELTYREVNLGNDAGNKARRGYLISYGVYSTPPP